MDGGFPIKSWLSSKTSQLGEVIAAAKIDSRMAGGAAASSSAAGANAAGAAVGSLSASGAGTPASGIEKEFELPQASVGRILKRKLPEGVTVSKEAKQAFAKAGGIFVLYLTHA